MSNLKMFSNYFDHLAEYQNQLLPDNKLNRDYIIIYDYLMDLLQKDDIVSKLIVRKKQLVTNINADILLDLTRLFDARGYIHEPYLCLTLTGRDNKRFTNVHPFCNEKLSIIPRNIKKNIWLALHSGLLMSGSFVRGYQGDIYEISLCSSDHKTSYIRLNCYSDDINLNFNLRVLINYSRNPHSESPTCKPYPVHELNAEWFAMLPRLLNSPFEVCLPKLEHEMKQTCFQLVMILRIYRFLFKKHARLSCLDDEFLESIIYSEYMKNIRPSKKGLQRYDYIFSGVLHRIYKAIKTKKCPSFWNERLNLIKYLDKTSFFSNGFHDLNNLLNKFKRLQNSDSLKYEEFFEFFDFKMEPFSYEVDQFGIYKSY